MLKMDTQGFESKILDGAINSLQSIRGTHIELSYIPFYETQSTAEEMISRMTALGFRLVKVDPFFFDDGAHVHEADGTFFQF